MLCGEKQEEGNIFLNKRVQLLIRVEWGEGTSMNAMNFHKE